MYAYYEGIDKVAHAEGLGDFYDDELRAADRLVADVLEVLPPGAVLVVTADHGQVDVGNSVVVLGPEIMEGLTLISGEGRFRWLHTRPGAIDDVVDAAIAAARRRGLGPNEGAGDRRRDGSAVSRRRRSRRGWETWP